MAWKIFAENKILEYFLTEKNKPIIIAAIEKIN